MSGSTPTNPQDWTDEDISALPPKFRGAALLTREQARVPSQPVPSGLDPKYVAFVSRAAEMMVRRLVHGRAKWGVDWDEQTYTDEDNLARLRRAVDHLEAAHRASPDPEEWRKRAADVANQAFMFADPARLAATTEPAAEENV